MNRRQFLTFTTERRLRVVELSCERLYMQLLDAELTSTPADDDQSSPFGGEPPASFHPRDPEHLFDGIERELAGADVLRVNEPSWLAAIPHNGRLGALIDRFRARGGRIEMAAPVVS